MPTQLEVIALGVWAAVALFAPRAVLDCLRPAARAFDAVARRRRLAVALVGLFGFGSSAAVSCLVAWPEPRVHDEFSYLLAADTFAHGRLANPQHPCWHHFETMHVIHDPAYASMYPPGQGLALAAGQVIFRHPLAGVWLSFGLACAAVCWMLQAWVPPRWALLGGGLAAVRVGFLGAAGDMPAYWSQSYWGGAVAMLGGALVFGALRRIVERPRWPYGLILGLGVAVLANSRPFEGVILCLPVAGALLAWRRGQDGPTARVFCSRVIAPAALVLGPTFGFMAAYNAAVTGSPFRLPYSHNGAAYAVTPNFLWQPRSPEPAYRHAIIRDYNVLWAAPAYDAKRTAAGYVHEVGQRLATLARFYLGPLLLVPLAVIATRLRDHWTRFAAGAVGLLVLALLQTTWLQPHYAAPATGLVFVLVVQGLRYLRTWRWQGRPTGRALVATLPVAYVVLFANAVMLQAQTDDSSWHLHRARLARDLERAGGRHLILVRYGPGHSPHDEWVYNAADINTAPIVWARDLGPEANADLLAHFADRQVWLLEPDVGHFRAMTKSEARMTKE